jgi:hypothetical protein
MKQRLVAIGIAVIAYATQLWPSINTGKSALPLCLLLAAISGVFAALLIRDRFVVPVMTVGAGFAVSDVVRIFYDISKDGTSHNLWPFELVIAVVLGAAGAIVGVGIVRLAQRLRSPERGRS